jgi:hypothetical protein
MSEMRDRVIKAIEEKHDAWLNSSTEVPFCEFVADAVFDALDFPTEQMLNAGFEHGDYPTVTWRSMIAVARQK